MTKESAVSKGGSKNLLEEIAKLMVGLLIDEFIDINVHGREELLLSANHCSPKIHCQYSYKCSRGNIFFKKVWDSVERNVDMVLHQCYANIWDLRCLGGCV